MLKQHSNASSSTEQLQNSPYKRVVYFIVALVALTIYVLQKQHVILPTIINNYLNDLLCMPLVLGALTFAIRRLKKDYLFTLSLVFILVMTSFYALYFEYYLPQINSRYTADWVDVFLYFIGGIAFYYVEKRQ